MNDWRLNIEKRENKREHIWSYSYDGMIREREAHAHRITEKSKPTNFIYPCPFKRFVIL